MARFSERFGFTQARALAQVDEIDEPLRIALWNVMYVMYYEAWSVFQTWGHPVTAALWSEELHRDLATLPDNPYDSATYIKQIFTDGQIHEVYNLVEAVVEMDARPIESFNAALTKHLSAYRIVNRAIAKLTDNEEIAEVEAALSDTSPHEGARHSLQQALILYSRSDNPDYANSIKESISAVESVARAMTGKRDLGTALDQIKRDRREIHSALIAGWKSLYGYASDEPAIRHGGATAPAVDQDLARYFLVTSSAMVNYLTALND